MWIPKCCDAKKANISALMRNQVKIYINTLQTRTEDGVQKNRYSKEIVITKRCYIKDRSLTAQDTAINSGIKEADAATAKELIFQYFDVTNYKFNEIEWSGTRFLVLNTSKLATANINGTKYEAIDSRPFISIIVGLKKL